MKFRIFCYINCCKNIYSCISCNLFLFWSWLSEWTVETVSDLFLVCPNSIPSLSGILFSLLQSIVLCSEIPRALSSSLVIKIWTSSCPELMEGYFQRNAHWLNDIGHYISIWWEDPQRQQWGTVGNELEHLCMEDAWRTLLLFCTAFQNSDMGNWMQLKNQKEAF